MAFQRSPPLAEPSSITQSSPSTYSRVGPYFTVWAPAALLAIMPPIVATSPLDGSGGNQRPNCLR